MESTVGAEPGDSTLPMIADSATASTGSGSSRLVSLDALRGFDMFWILGADALVLSSGSAEPFGTGPRAERATRTQGVGGFSFYDLIFPLFVFIVGVSMVFSLTRVLAQESRATAIKRILRRAAVLFVLGIFYNGGLTLPWPEVRLVGVLQRIAIAYAVTGLLFCFLRPRTWRPSPRPFSIGYWGVMTFVPIRDIQLADRALIARWPDIPVDQRGHAQRDHVRKLFDATEPTVTARFEPGLNVADHLDFRVRRQNV